MNEVKKIDPATLHCLDATAAALDMIHWPLPRVQWQKILAVCASGGNCVFHGEELAKEGGGWEVRWFLDLYDPDAILDKVDREILLAVCRRRIPEARLSTDLDNTRPRFAVHDTWRFHKDGSPHPPCCDPRHPFGYGDFFLVKGKLLREIVCSRCNRLWDVSAA